MKKRQLNLLSMLIMIMMSVIQLNAFSFQSKQISGQVLDRETGAPLVGATVREDATQNGTITDIDGNFFLELKNDTPSIVVSYVGYKTQTIDNPSTIQKIYLDSNVIEEVVVIAYGETKKEDLTTAISTVKIDQEFKSRPADFLTMIQGQLPGMTIQTGGGDPLGNQSRVAIRGIGSQNNDGVLYVVDGVPNAPFNTEDIETVTVLKDAASASMYGSYVGAGGVVLITTKKAQAGKIQVDVNVSKGFAKATNLPEVLTAEELTSIQKDAYDNDPTKSIPSVFQNDFTTTTRTNWFDEIFRTANVDHYAVSMSGGSDKMKGLASFSYDTKEGTLLNTHAKNIGLRGNLEVKPLKWLSIKENLFYNKSNGQGNINSNTHEGILASALFFPRSSTIYDIDENGNILTDIYGNQLYMGTTPRYIAEQGIGGFGEIRNPYATLMRLNQDQPTNEISSTTGLTIQPIKNLILRSDYTYRNVIGNYKSFSPRVEEPGRPSLVNSLTRSNNNNNFHLWETTANYVFDINNIHQFNSLVGGTINDRRYENFRTGGDTFQREDKYNIVLGNNHQNYSRPSEGIAEESGTSIYGRLGYSFSDRYFITTSIRRDETSRLAKGNRSDYFPAVSGSWKVSSEPFFDISDIQLLKLRASWGQVGDVSAVPLYSAYPLVGNESWENFFGRNGQTITTGKVVKNQPNTNLTWETTEQFDIGIDAEFKNLSINIDYFDKTTKDLIDQLDTPSTAGNFNSPYGNIGEVSNKGWEFLVKYHKNFNQDLHMNVSGNLSTVKNEVIDLSDREFFEHGNRAGSNFRPLRSEVGQPWFSFYLYQTNGIFQTQTEVDASAQPDAQPGDIIFVDKNNDGLIDDNDKSFMGSYLPNLTYSLSPSFNYKNFDLSLFIQGVSGNKIFNGYKAMGLSGRGSNNMLTDVKDSWEYNPNSGLPRRSFLTDNNGNLTRPSDFFLENGSYARLKNLTLGYTFPTSLLEKMNIPNSSFRVYGNANNLLTLTNYSGIDPEVGNNGVDGGRYPISKTFSFGANFNF